MTGAALGEAEVTGSHLQEVNVRPVVEPEWAHASPHGLSLPTLIPCCSREFPGFVLPRAVLPCARHRGLPADFRAV